MTTELAARVEELLSGDLEFLMLADALSDDDDEGFARAVFVVASELLDAYLPNLLTEPGEERQVDSLVELVKKELVSTEPYWSFIAKRYRSSLFLDYATVAAAFFVQMMAKEIRRVEEDEERQETDKAAG